MPERPPPLMIQPIPSVCCRAAAHPAELAGSISALDAGVVTHVGAGGVHGIARFAFTDLARAALTRESPTHVGFVAVIGVAACN